ncbi:hypothetical protein K9M42_03025 [Patescibacteria group bacterium]|nr:hypothetical protein [Patescibacteria group bacterium]
MYIANKTSTFLFKVLFIITIIVLVIIIIFNLSEIPSLEKIFLNLLERLVDFIRSLFVVSHVASREIINNFKLP